ncbi:hypothetical protein MRX96_024811 [Rhipicephalus microplus]
MDFSNSRKRLQGREAQRCCPGASAGTTALANSPATASTDDLVAPRDPCPPSPPTEELPLPATSPQGVESTLPAPEAEGTTESPDNPPPDASATIKVVEEVLNNTSAGGNTRKEAPYTAKDFLLTPSAGGHTYQPQKEGKEEADQEAIPGYCIEGTRLPTSPQPFGKAPHCSRTPLRRHSSAAGSPPRHRGLPGGHYQRCPKLCQGPCCCCGPPGRPCHCGHSSLPAVGPGSGSGGARGDLGGADLCERGEGPPFAAPPLQPDPSRHLANLVASHSRDSSPLALLPLWPRRRPLLFLRPRLLLLPLSRPSLLLLSPETGLLCPQLLWPRLLRQ